MKIHSWPKRKASAAKAAKATSWNDYFDPALRKHQGPVLIELPEGTEIDVVNAPVIN